MKEQNRTRVLIADDSALIRERLVEMLAEIPGIKIVGKVENGLEAIEITQRLSPNLVVLDIRMPKCNGIEVLKSINKNGHHPMVIVLTNYPTYRQKCVDIGADFFLDKSTEFDKVPKLLNWLINGPCVSKDATLFEHVAVARV